MEVGDTVEVAMKMLLLYVLALGIPSLYGPGTIRTSVQGSSLEPLIGLVDGNSPLGVMRADIVKLDEKGFESLGVLKGDRI